MSGLSAYAWSEKPERRMPLGNPVRTYVWELPVRVSHWFIFLPVVVLSFTGYYMHNLFIVAQKQHAFLMATMRFTHLVAGSVFISAFILRMYWFFRGESLVELAFVLADPARAVARHGQHGRLLQLFPKEYRALRRPQRPGSRDLPVHVHADVDRDHHRADSLHARPWSMAVGVAFLAGFPASSIFPLAPRPLLHHVCLLRFVIHHVYSAVLVSWEERNGLIESIFTGYKFVPEAELRESGAA